ncbi:MAG: SCP2 sterol-binding domain-containing protein [Oscillospiraceae bacterium]|nr:SCP2 sterol-binding domain-containing protein [Oscillospiraceae bacterium]
MTKGTAKAAEKKTAAKKPAAEKAVKAPAAEKTAKVTAPAAEKTVKAAKPAAKKAAAKPAAKKTAAAKKAPAKAAKAAKPAVKKPKVVGIDEMCKKLEKLVDKKKAAAVKANVAVDVKVWGWADETDRHFYIEIKDGALTISPFEYNAASFEAYISYDNMLQFLNGKLTLANAIASGALNANGNIPAALALGNIF